MDAGEKRVLLWIRYDGVERLVEPYALAYKRRRTDGMASEYFYVWDQTGGRSSGPGLKSLFHHKIAQMDLTETTFEPRYPMELAKAGERASKEYFGREFVGARREGLVSRPRTRAAARSAYGMVYRVECPYCQKQFSRSTTSTALKPHKDANGYPCAGRNGYRVY